MDQALLNLLVCPSCRGALWHDSAEARLVCMAPACRRAYPIRDTIPVMLEAAAAHLDDAAFHAAMLRLNVGRLRRPAAG